jgi:hypothetical protein
MMSHKFYLTKCQSKNSHIPTNDEDYKPRTNDIHEHLEASFAPQSTRQGVETRQARRSAGGSG